MKEKLQTLTIDVPFKRAGNVISQQAITFDLYRDGDTYSLVPWMDDQSRAVAGLPDELFFVMWEGKPHSVKGKKDLNFHVIQDAVNHLKTSGQYSF